MSHGKTKTLKLMDISVIFSSLTQKIPCQTSMFFSMASWILYRSEIDWFNIFLVYPFMTVYYFMGLLSSSLDHKLLRKPINCLPKTSWYSLHVVSFNNNKRLVSPPMSQKLE